MKSHGKALAEDTKVLDKAVARRLVSRGMTLAIAGVVLSAVAAIVDRKRFAFSYLTGFTWIATIALGALFFVLIQHLTRARWSAAARRHMEWMSGVLPACAVLFLPIAVLAHDIYHHWMGPEAAHDALLRQKAAYLNPTFFYIRAVVYLAAWAGLSIWFIKTSRAQDESADMRPTAKMRASSAPAIIVFALTLSFASFDWLMSIDPHWYSTIFGVYVFSGAATSSLSALALITIALHKAGLLRNVSNIERQHDIGKLLFGFTIFWAYIAFSQYLLIWYANIPEETIFFRHRWEGSWKAVSLALLFGHFVVPFLVLLSRHAKRSPVVLGAASVLLLVMHYVDLYWLIMPNLDHHGAHLSWIDLAGLLGPLGVGAWVVSMQAAKSPLYPLNDPHLADAARIDNP
ncbi:hypothetical protein SOCE26_089200 [Sorangium cellulosum]|uniref:Quinol:cytochrome C oxidoreductase n=1 Tax=Sorangium cellulosum TaxID=56 RepID=A0A2L0F765_SORCE|nr:hypothetical protein [Sorangium cellulosum]AUX47400.1 hypothetical protein SOCE26_089200 [Sorangium cellulosum]